MTQLDGPRWGPGPGEAIGLIVLCHGVGADGFDLIDLAPHWAGSVPGVAFAAPHGPEPYDMAPFGRQWFSLQDRTLARLATGVAAASDSLDSFIDSELLRLGLPPKSVALMGFSQGAMTVLHAGLRRAIPPLAILAFSGALLPPASLGATRPQVLLVHGEADEVVPVERSRLAESVLQAAGVPVESHYAAGLGHGLDDTGLALGGLALQRAFAG